MSEKIKSFRNLRIWQDGIELVKEIYKITQAFPKSEIYGLVSQMRRASISIPSNIAEGHIRGHTQEFKQFLFIALSSLAELETQTVIAKELNFIDEKRHIELIEQMNVIGRQIRSLISKLTPNP